MTSNSRGLNALAAAAATIAAKRLSYGLLGVAFIQLAMRPIGDR